MYVTIKNHTNGKDLYVVGIADRHPRPVAAAIKYAVDLQLNLEHADLQAVNLSGLRLRGVCPARMP